MKNYKDLDAAQKIKANTEALARAIDDLSFRNSKKLSSKKMQELINASPDGLCGCYGCSLFITERLKTDNELKEFVISEARTIAENAYYPDADDEVINVS